MRRLPGPLLVLWSCSRPRLSPRIRRRGSRGSLSTSARRCRSFRATICNWPRAAVSTTSRSCRGADSASRSVLHVYVLRVKVITFGLGAEFARAKSSQTPATGSTLPAMDEQFSTSSPQLSLNFGNGWVELSERRPGHVDVVLVPTGQPTGTGRRRADQDAQLRRRRALVREIAPRLQPRRAVLRHQPRQLAHQSPVSAPASPQ